MIVIPKLGILDNNAYIIDKYNEAVVVDAPAEGEKILEALKKNNLKLKYILITHGHPDHIASVSLLKDKTGAQIVAHEKDMKLFLKPWNFILVKAKPFKPDILIEANEEIRLGKNKFISLKVLHTPGHTQGGICFYEEKEKSVFTGDTLFYGAIGRTDLPGGDFEQLVNSIKNKLLNLPEDTKVFPGHGLPTSIKRERFNF